MADLLQRLILLAAACATLAPAAAPFSHRRHLALKIPCTQCHAAAATSTKAADVLLPAASACATCHDDSRMPRATPATSFVTRFNHALHARISNIGPLIAAAATPRRWRR